MYCNQCGAVIGEGQSFCMRCGNPVGVAGGQSAGGQTAGTQTMTGQTAGNPYSSGQNNNNIHKERKSGIKKGLIAGIILAIVGLIGLVAALAFLVIRMGLFLPVPEKILLAGVNTFKTPTKIGKAVGQVGNILNDDFTLEADMDYEKFSLTNGAITCSDGRLQAAGDVSYVVITAKDCMIDLDDDALRVSIPKFYDKTIAYYYREDSKMLEEVASDYLAQTNDALITINTLAHNRKLNIDKKEYKLFLDWWNALEFETEKGVKTEVDGKKKKCTLYSVDVSGNDVKELIDITDQFVENNTNDEIEDLMKHYDISTEQFFEDIKDELGGDLDESITIDFYVYKGKIVRVSFTNPDNDEIRINMNGSKSPWTESEVLYKQKDDDDYETVFTAEYELEDDLERYTFESLENDTVSETAVFEYNSKDGAYDLKLSDEKEDILKMQGILLVDDKTGSFEINNIEENGTEYDFSLTTNLRRGAEFREYPEKEMNLNEADILDLAEMGKNIQDKFNIFN